MAPSLSGSRRATHAIIALVLALCSVSEGDCQPLSGEASAEHALASSPVIENMPTNDGTRCFGIAAVTEALLEGERIDQADGADDCEQLALRIYDRTVSGRPVHFHPHVLIGGSRVPTYSRYALDELSARVTGLRNQHLMSVAPPRRFFTASYSFVKSVAELDEILDSDPDKALVLSGLGKRWFPDGTVKDSRHAVLICKWPNGEKRVYDSNDPGSPIDCQLIETGDWLVIGWTCKYRNTGHVTTQRYHVTPCRRWSRLALGACLQERDGWLKQLDEALNEGRFDEALSCVRQALAIERAELSESHPDVFRSLDTIAEIQEARNDWVAVERARQEHCSLAEKACGRDHWRTTEARLHVERARRVQGFTPAERQRLRRVEDLSVRAGQLYTDHKPLQALPLATQALRIHSELLGKECPKYADLLEDVALMYRAMGDSAKAEPLYVEARDIRARVLGCEHPAYAASLNNLARLYSDMANAARAKSLGDPSREIRDGLVTAESSAQVQFPAGQGRNGS